MPPAKTGRPLAAGGLLALYSRASVGPVDSIEKQ